MQENKALAKKMNIAAIILSVIILLLVGMMRRPEFKIHTSIDFSFLPPFHATLNSFVAIALVFALYFIKQKNILAHRRSIYVAIMFSVLFLLSYVVYHFTTEETRFCQEGTIKIVYLFLLITHIVLAGLSLPFILFTFTRAYTGQIARHRKMARWVYPIWLYVAITGPICYLMLRPCYG